METPLQSSGQSKLTVTLSQIPTAKVESEATHGPDWTLPGPSSSSSPLLFGDYEVVGELGEGGMGRVYKAIDRKLGRHVAVKVLRSTDPFEASRFRGEAEMIALLSHPNIVQIFAIDSAPDGRPYIALEYAESGSLDRELSGQPLEPRRAAEMAEILARAVQYAHEKGVIHRDLKPANVLRSKGGVLKLTDFGLAKQLDVSSGMTPSGAVMGTPSYMAPEQAEGKVKQLGPPTDVYGLGAILYEMITGRPPFRGVNLVDTLEQVRWAEPAAPSQFVPRLHRDLATICLKCLRKSPSQRYATAGELADDLRRWLNGETIVARSAASWERVWRQVRRRPWQAATVVACGVAVGLLVLGGIVYQNRQLQLKAQDQVLAFEREMAAQKQAEQETLARTQRENEIRLHKRSDDALMALDGIRNMILNGDLRNTKELDPLKGKLFTYYKTLNDQLKSEAGYDKNKLAQSWLEIGKLIQETGSKDKAWDAFIEARELYHSTRSDTVESRTNRADAEGTIGRLAYELNKYDDASKSCDIVEALLSNPKPTNADQFRLLGEAWHLRGQLFDRDPHNRGKTAEAFEKAIAFQKEALNHNLGAHYNLTPSTLAALPAQLSKLETTDPAKFSGIIENLRGLALGYGFLGDVWLNAYRLADADKAYWNAHNIRQAVMDTMRKVDQSTGRYHRELSQAQSQFSRGWGNCASIQTRARALGTAKYFSELALEFRKKISTENPNTIEYHRDVCTSANQVAELKIILGEEDGVSDLLDLASNIPKDISEDRGGYSNAALGIIADTHLLRAQFLAKFQGDDKARLLTARRELGEARTSLEKLHQNDPHNAVLAFRLAAVYALSSDITTSSDTAEGRRKRALEMLKLALELGYRDKHPDDIRLVRAFEKLKGDSQFEELLAKFRVARETEKEAAIKTSSASP